MLDFSRIANTATGDVNNYVEYLIQTYNIRVLIL